MLQKFKQTFWPTWYFQKGGKLGTVQQPRRLVLVERKAWIRQAIEGWQLGEQCLKVGLSIRPGPGRGSGDCMLTKPQSGDLRRQPLGLEKPPYLSLGKHCVLITFPSLVTFHPNPQWSLLCSVGGSGVKGTWFFAPPCKEGFPGGADGKESACSAGDLGLILGLGRPPGEGNGNLLQYSCLENSMDRGA